jgi:hypothetical protein
MITPALLGWRSQYDRMLRGAAQLALPYASSIAYQDDLQHFLQDCWHLKDWIQNDRGRHKDPSTEAVFDRYPALRVVQELSIACKHGNQDKIGSLGAYVAHDATDPSIPGTPVQAGFCVCLHGGSELLTSELVEDVMLAWEDILRRARLL